MYLATPTQDILTRVLRSCRRHFLDAAAFSAFLNVLYLAPTLYMLQIYDRVVPTRGHLTLWLLTVVLFFAVGVLSLLDLARSRLMVRASMRLDRQLAGAILESTLARPTGGRSALTKQAMREFDTLRQTLTGPAMLALFDAPWTPIYIAVCFLLHPLLGAVALAGALILALISVLNDRATRPKIQRANEAANIAYVSQEFTAASAEVVRALGMMRAMVARQLAQRETSQQLSAQANFAGGGYLAATRFVRLAVQSLALGVGAYLAIEQKISAGAIFASSFLVARALAPVEQVLGASRNFTQARSAWRTLTEIFARSPANVALTELPAPTGGVEADRLSVLTPARDRAILQQVSFKLSKGEAVGIIGPSGAGKSTLMRMLAGAGAPDGGVIRLDEAEMGDYEPERLAAYIGYMPQEASLFAGTVKENIARFSTQLGEDRDIDAKVIAAARACGAHEMILHLSDGYESMLGLGGQGLSAGQAQRIALARALYGEPPILLLDEPNAHLDLEGEAQLVVTLKTLKDRGATVLIVAHRTGVLSAVDKLMLLRDGHVELYGPRDAVIARLGAATRAQITAAAAAEATSP
jgi:ATP-binding cassette subfamily C protein